MSGKPENIVVGPVINDDTAIITQPELSVSRDPIPIMPTKPTQPDIGTVIGWWRDSQALASIRDRIADAKTAIMMLEKALDEASPIDTSLASLRRSM